MLCSRPFTQGLEEFGCGQCMPCRLNRRRLWTARLMLEAQKHEHSCFLTLTYDDDHLPVGGTLVKRDVQLFLKRIRRAGFNVRYYVVGEYGDRSKRPHYHMALFGFYDVLTVLDRRSIVVSGVLKDSWPHGHVHFGTLTPDSAGYIVSYVVKRMTNVTDVRLRGLLPEFATMSLRPGIGATRVDDFAGPIVRGVDTVTGEFYALPDGDIPGTFRYDGSTYPLGRYLRRRLRLAVGMRVEEPIICGQLRNYKRFVDLSAAGKNGYKVREARRLQSDWNAKGRIERFSSKKGIGL